MIHNDPQPGPYNTDKHGEHYADWNKPDRKRQTLHGIT